MIRRRHKKRERQEESKGVNSRGQRAVRCSNNSKSDDAVNDHADRAYSPRKCAKSTRFHSAFTRGSSLCSLFYRWANRAPRILHWAGLANNNHLPPTHHSNAWLLLPGLSSLGRLRNCPKHLRFNQWQSQEKNLCFLTGKPCEFVQWVCFWNSSSKATFLSFLCCLCDFLAWFLLFTSSLSIHIPKCESKSPLGFTL